MLTSFHTFCLTQAPRKERLKLIRASFEMYHYQCQGIHLVVIDGIADLIGAVNNESESIEVIEELYTLAGIYKTCVVCVLHLTPSGLKIRGHLGSELQRKAATVLSIEKDSKSEVSMVRLLKVRGGSLTKMHCYYFDGMKAMECIAIVVLRAVQQLCRAKMLHWRH